MLEIKFFPEQKLINRIRTNDRTVLGELFVRYEKLVAIYVQTHGGDSADAEDMLQESIIVLWQKVCSREFELTSKLGTYILAIAKNKWRGEQRRRKKFADSPSPPDSPDESPDALDSMMRDEQAATVQSALHKLRSPCRELLTLFYFEQRRAKDIARILGFANADVVKAKKYQCKKAFQVIWNRHMAETERKV